MKKLICTLGVIFGLLLLNGCGMKECKCVSTNTITQNDTIDYRVDTVFNYTRGDCKDFEKNETLKMDSITFVTHIMICQQN